MCRECDLTENNEIHVCTDKCMDKCYLCNKEFCSELEIVNKSLQLGKCKKCQKFIQNRD